MVLRDGREANILAARPASFLETFYVGLSAEKLFVGCRPGAFEFSTAVLWVVHP